MSKLAATIANADVPAPRTRRGPSADCDVYGPGDLEDYDAVDDLRRRTSWAHAHAEVDKAAGIERRFVNDKFRYHWRMRCGHWTDEQRQARA
jgi:hypothetical protein